MTATSLPSDASSLLVPIHLDAWVVDSQNQEVLARYTADYDKLKQFESPIPEPFGPSGGSRPEPGVHLHWALPDALAHGRAPGGGGPIEFPLVPNRWLIMRSNTAAGKWQCRLWVVQSDYLGSTSGTTAGSSAFLDPFKPSAMEATPSTPTAFAINKVNVGRSYPIEAWEALPETEPQKLYLQAVAPGNVSFAAYVPFVKDVFSFIDTELPAEDRGQHSFTYLVVGWYSGPEAGDPLRGVTTCDPGCGQSQAEWQAQTPEQRLSTVLAGLKWSVKDAAGAPLPATSLYHGLVAGVQWPLGTARQTRIDQVQVAVGNTGIDALAALVQAQAPAHTQAEQTKQNPPDHKSGKPAGKTLAELMQAAMYDLLDEYGKPGGATRIRQQIQQAWFGSKPGGTVWEVVSDVPQAAGQQATPPQLTSEQADTLTQLLAALNRSQRDLDEQQRVLESLQADLCMIWLKIGRANPSGWGVPSPIADDIKGFMETQIYPALIDQVWDQFCDVSQARQQLPDPDDQAAANDWANAHWDFPTPHGSTKVKALGLKLKASTMPRFWHPNDPVVLISGLHRSRKHGEDGRYNRDGTLTCRLPGQTVTGIQVPGLPAINVQTLSSSGLNLDPCGPYTRIPGVAALVHEAFLADPGNAPLIAGAVQGNADTIQAAITNLIRQTPGKNRWVGQPPAPFGIRPWEQAWAPLFLEWDVLYYPTGAGDGPSRQFSMGDWHFDGEDYAWNGTGFDANYSVEYKGRTLLTPQAPLHFKHKIRKYLKHHSKIDAPELEKLIETVAGWDVLSQSLSGLLDQLITLQIQETFAPPPGGIPSVPCPRPETGDSQPGMAALIGDQYHAMPILEGDRQDRNYFYPVRGGFLQIEKLRIVDAFGQIYPESGWISSGQGFVPIRGRGLAPTKAPDRPAAFPHGLIQLPPRLVQSARLDFRFLANDGSGEDILASNKPDAVCGWLLPNHLDGGIAVYDGGGVLLGELLPAPDGAPDSPVVWRPRPGPAPIGIDEIKNPALQAVVKSILGQTTGVFGDMLDVIDETLWMVDPLGGRKDQFLSVLIGRPLAVVQAELQLDLYGNAVFDQMWERMVTPQPPYQWLKDIGDVKDVAFPVRLGSLDLRDDGLIGYFLPNKDDSATFYAVHIPEDIKAGAEYIRPIMGQLTDGHRQYQGDIYLKCQGDSVKVTMIVDPRGAVHAHMGILPVTRAALPAHVVEDFLSQLKVTFRTGPIIADPGALRLPKPAEDHGVWTWIQRIAPGDTPDAWEANQVIDADDRARLPDQQLVLREGWLQLSDDKE